VTTIKKFEDFKAWQKARNLVREIYLISGRGKFQKDYVLKDQIRKAAISIMANIAEGYGRRSSLEFANFLNYAHGSAAEVQSHLYVALDQNYISETEFHQIYRSCEENSKIVLGLQNYVRKHKIGS
jgi:four helix bundle protein